MRELSYDVLPHRNGFAIVITPERADAFAAKHEAFDAAIELTRKLRFAGVAMQVRPEQTPARPGFERKAS
jgi:hypothetical protein